MPPKLNLTDAEKYQRSVEQARIRMQNKRKRDSEKTNNLIQENEQLKRQCNIIEPVKPPCPCKNDDEEIENDDEEIENVDPPIIENPSPSPSPPAPAPLEIYYPGTSRMIKIKKKVSGNKHTLAMVLEKMEILDTYKSPGAKKIYMDKVKRVFELTGCTYFEDCVSQYKKFTTDLENKKQPNGDLYSPGTLLMYISAIRYAYDHVPGLHIDKKIKDQYTKLIDILKIKAKAEQDAKKTSREHEIPTIPNYLKKINDQFPEHSKQRLVANLQLSLGCRDDVAGMIITEKNILDDDVEVKNYIIVPKTKNKEVSVILNDTKTSRKYGNLRFSLDKEVSSMVRYYIGTNKRKYGETLFNEKGLSQYISLMHKKINVPGSINTIRQMVASTDMEKGLSIEEKYDRAIQSGHSLYMHGQYCRLFAASV